MSNLKFNSYRTVELLLFGCMVLGLLAAPMLLGQQERETEPKPSVSYSAENETLRDKNLQVANFGAGCFWCVEAVFQQLKGVKSVESGYMGGAIDNPTYEQVCTGQTGHAEICQITFDPKVITFPELLEVFWQTHDPTTLNRQGADSGTQYRSAVFFVSKDQQEQAQKYKQRLDESGAFKSKIVTEISPATNFFSAGDYHASYFQRNPNAGYCQFVIRPKLDKFKKAFGDKLNSGK